MSVDDIMKYITTNEIKWVNFYFTDISGKMHKLTLSSGRLLDDHFKDGLYLDGLENVLDENAKNLVLLPDVDSFGRVPWDQSSIRLMGYLLNRKKEHYSLDSRYVSKRIKSNVSALGLNNLEIGFDIDFRIFETATIDRATGRFGGTAFDSRESKWAPSPYLPGEHAKYTSEPNDSGYTLRSQIADLLNEGFNYIIGSHYHGPGRTSHQTFSVIPLNIVEASDDFQTIKMGVKLILAGLNATATFMPYPIEGESPNALNISQSLWKKDNVFFDSTDEYAQISQTARYYIGGILNHLNSILLFTLPTVNSYKGLTPKNTVAGWSAMEENSAVFVPNSKIGDRYKKRVSFNLADPSVNPYLAFSALVSAGLDGIKHKIEPGDPIEKKDKHSKELKLPSNIEESIENFMSDTRFVRTILSSEMIEAYISEKKKEQHEHQNKLTQWEFVKYFDV